MADTQIHIVENSRLARLARVKLRSTNVAMVLGKKIHLSGVSKVDFLSDAEWLAHEMVHIRQFKQHGFIKFLYLYVVEWMRHGYYNNKFEIEARREAAALTTQQEQP